MPLNADKLRVLYSEILEKNFIHLIYEKTTIYTDGIII